MKLAIVSPYPPLITGISQYGYHISRILADSGLFSDVTVLAGSPEAGPARRESKSMSVEYTWQPEKLNAGLAIQARLRQLKPDLVWYNLGATIFGRSPLANLASFVSLGLGQERQTPAVVTLHELVQLADLRAINAPSSRLVRFGASLLTNAAIHADVLCLTLRRYVSWYAAHRPDLACMHIPIGSVRPPEFLPESSSPEILFFTSHAPFKGLEVLLAAYQSLLERNPDLRLTIAGSEHPRFPGYLEAVRCKYGHLKGIRWEGEVPDDQIRALFKRAQVVALPYMASTGSSSVLYQAAAWGRPVVVSDIPDLCSIVDENNLAVEFFQSGESASLADAIQTLLDAPAHRRSMAEHNFNIMLRMCPEETCRLYLQAFNRAFETCHSSKRLDIPALAGAECS